MTSRPLRAGIIGLSWIGADRAGPASSPELGTAPPYSHASAIAATPGLELVAGCDVSGDAGDRFVELWQDTWPDLATFTDSSEMLRTTDLDLVSVVVPDHLHGTVIHQCIDASVPMIFAEKPFTTDLREADELLRRIEETGTAVSVNHTWRWRPEVAEARAVIARGDLGPLANVSIQAGGPRAMLFRNLTHFLDLALHLAGGEPEWVAAELEAGSEDYGLVYNGDGGRDPALDPGALVHMGFAGGVRAQVNGLKATSSDVVIDLSCLEGRIVIDTLGARVVETRRNNDGTPGSNAKPVVSGLSPRHSRSGMAAVLADLIAAHAEGREPAGSARSARTTVAVLDAVLRSQAAGNSRVHLSPPGGASDVVEAGEAADHAS